MQVHDALDGASTLLADGRIGVPAPEDAEQRNRLGLQLAHGVVLLENRFELGERLRGRLLEHRELTALAMRWDLARILRPIVLRAHDDHLRAGRHRSVTKPFRSGCTTASPR